MAKKSKKHREAASKIESRQYQLDEAVTLLKSFDTAKFDETVEVAMRLGVDPRHADQQVRGVILMPAGLGKTVRVLVFAEGEAERIANEAGADIVGADELIAEVEGGFMDFDVAIAVPEMMRKMGKLGKVLGPRGLMPSPKAGTVVQAEDIPRVIEETRAGRVEYRNDRTANLHTVIGKASFTPDALMQNFSALMDAIRRDRPASAKGQYIRKMVVSSTMRPGVKIDPNIALALEVAE